MADCGWSNSIPTKCRRIDYDSIVLTVDHVEKTFELLNHHRLRRSRLSRPFDHRENLIACRANDGDSSHQSVATAR
jgi:hypothetical protein